MADNLTKLFNEITPDVARKSIAKMSGMTNSAQDIFDDLAEKHHEMGAGVCLPIARNIVRSIRNAVADDSATDKEKDRRILAIIAPMVIMHYDVYQKKQIDELEKLLGEEAK